MARLYATVTQGANDAFAQATLQTGLEGVTQQAYSINQIGYEFILPTVPNFPKGAAAAQALRLSVNRRTKTAVPTYVDPDIIKKWQYASSWQTLVGAEPIFPSVDYWIPRGDVLIVEPQIYVTIGSDATAAIWSAVVFIDYDIVKISEVDRLTLLTQSLV